MSQSHLHIARMGPRRPTILVWRRGLRLRIAPMASRRLAELTHADSWQNLDIAPQFVASLNPKNIGIRIYFNLERAEESRIRTC
jgi:hypothetical protein